MSIKKGAKPAWYGLAAVTIGTGIFFLAANKGRLFKKGAASLKSLLSGAAPVVAEPVAIGGRPAGRTPANGHGRAANASTPPPPGSGSSFTPQGDGHEPKA